ncbi:MAG: SpvB/TcaC N-terminal domain-containing protein [Dongiaceae bacterium]
MTNIQSRWTWTRIRVSAVQLLARGFLALSLICISAIQAPAQEQDGSEEEGAAGKQRLDSANGALNQSVDIEVPPFRGLEPNISLSYDSGRDNGFVGVGWRLGGLSVIERSSPRFGTPRYDATDIFYLDGDELKACVAGMTSPSCTTGGTHTTRIESFLKIRRDTAANTWEVWNRDGTKLTYQRVGIWGTYSPTDPDAVKRATAHRWLLQTVTDTHGQTVTYGYWCDGVPDCYVDTITYNGNTVRFYRESRTDPISYATGAGLAAINYRLKSVDVLVGGQRARAFALTYGTGSNAARSRLASVQQFGRDASVNATTGAVTGNTSLPPTSFTYQDGTGSFQGSSWVASTVLFTRGDFNGDGRMDYVRRYPTRASAG